VGVRTLPRQKTIKPKKAKKKQVEQKKQAKRSKQPKPSKLKKGLKRAKKKQPKQVKNARPWLKRSAEQDKKRNLKGGSTRESVTRLARLPMAAPHMRIGLLGGSFNPPHEAHVDVSLAALKRLGLDQVWWLVTPGNPLKDTSALPGVGERVQAAKDLVTAHPRIAVTGFTGGKASPYTIDLLAELKRRLPAVNFVWLMGADNLAGFHCWRAWERIFKLMPIAVLDRPGFRLKARASQAAQRFAAYHVDESDASGLAGLEPPAWTIVSHRLSALSSTKLRAKKPNGKKAKGKDEKNNKRGMKH
jgi:nicotinate-nucleotide adenylyltransferase